MEELEDEREYCFPFFFLKEMFFLSFFSSIQNYPKFLLETGLEMSWEQTLFHISDIFFFSSTGDKDPI